MHGKRWLLTGSLLASSIIGYTAAYREWHRKDLARLIAGSEVISTNHGPIEYRKIGSGPAVLLAHGTPGGYDMGLAFTQLLSDPHYTYLAISRPGYLRTPLETGLTPEEQADAYAALLDTLGIQRATIVGISGGGPSAIQFSLRHPERCSSLIMVSGVAQHYSEQEVWQTLPLFKRLTKQLYNKLVAFDPFIYTILPLAGLQPAGAAATDLVRTATLYSQRRRGYENDMRQFRQITRYPLKNISVPTLVVHGTSDDEVLFENAEALASEVPHVRLLAIPGGSHMAFYTHASIVMPAIKNFLQRTS
ncbi:alpha/beta fold hydrolase [Dictyobacter arantiisoli]|uniref:Alpha/beta hydrolase n=1 Tax=Dictyobacter arantiisoli TaxID=2014874 RepID=A0A5A5TD65_9CHLR|nr:alpha/beta hydrolase [Dictyobacter arantiisoli]GCF09287.1 alpha/beta hydrolase [Dictyobacter arantiisoli]